MFGFSRFVFLSLVELSAWAGSGGGGEWKLGMAAAKK